MAERDVDIDAGAFDACEAMCGTTQTIKRKPIRKR
jgi:hypothetical protein